MASIGLVVASIGLVVAFIGLVVASIGLVVAFIGLVVASIGLVVASIGLVVASVGLVVASIGLVVASVGLVVASIGLVVTSIGLVVASIGLHYFLRDLFVGVGSHSQQWLEDQPLIRANYLTSLERTSTMDNTLFTSHNPTLISFSKELRPHLQCLPIWLTVSHGFINFCHLYARTYMHMHMHVCNDITY